MGTGTSKIKKHTTIINDKVTSSQIKFEKDRKCSFCERLCYKTTNLCYLHVIDHLAIVYNHHKYKQEIAQQKIISRIDSRIQNNFK